MLNTSSAILDDLPPTPIAHWAMEPTPGPSPDDRRTVYEYGPTDVNNPNGKGTKQTSKTVYAGPDYAGEFELLSKTDYLYDAAGRMTGVEIDSDGDGTPDQIVTYSYDSRSLRVGESDGTTTTTYLFDANNPTGYVQVLEEYADGALDKTYTLGMDVIAQYDDANGVLTLLYDAHGSTRALLDSSGAIVEGQVFTFDAYGNAVGFDLSAALTSHGYSGEWTDARLNVQWLGQGTGGDRGRIYSMSSGTFLTANPAGYNSITDPISLNNYLYVHGNPIMGIDPSGLFEINLYNLSITLGIVSILTGLVILPAYDAFEPSLAAVQSEPLAFADRQAAIVAGETYFSSHYKARTLIGRITPEVQHLGGG